MQLSLDDVNDPFNTFVYSFQIFQSYYFVKKIGAFRY